MNPWLRLVLVLAASIAGGFGMGCLIASVWLRRLREVAVG